MPQNSTEPASQRSAYRMAAMLIAIGIGHFAAPKPFDTIVPAELFDRVQRYVEEFRANGAAPAK
jgi:uncharacterized membrane protein